MVLVGSITELGARMGVSSDFDCQLLPPGHIFQRVLVGKAAAMLCIALGWLMTWVRNAGSTCRETLACKSDFMLSEDIVRAPTDCND